MKRLILLASLLLMAFSAHAGNDRAFLRPKKTKVPDKYLRTALLIGNSDYKSSPLKNPVNDVTDMGKKLQELGFEVTVITNADQRTMGKAISEFGESIQRRKGVALFYYAGHGMQVNGENYLIPLGGDFNSEEDVEFGSVSAGLAMAKMQKAQNPFNIIVLDACRDNPFSTGSRSGKKGLATLNAPVGSVIIYATSPGRTAADGDGKNGIFTKHMLDLIDTPDIDFEMMIRHVRAKVVSDTRGKQVPWTSSSLQGAFFMVGDGKGAPTIQEKLDPEAELWSIAKDSTNAKDVEAYLAKYPKGQYQSAAEMKLRQLKTANEPKKPEPKDDGFTSFTGDGAEGDDGFTSFTGDGEEESVQDDSGF